MELGFGAGELGLPDSGPLHIDPSLPLFVILIDPRSCNLDRDLVFQWT